MASKPVDKWTSRTVVWIADADPYSSNFREAYEWEVEDAKRFPKLSIYGGKNIYDSNYGLLGTDLKALLREKIKQCRNELDAAKDSIGYAISNLREEIKNL